jgi:hypothetical protein
MTDILLYWRDYKKNWAEQPSGEYGYYWHTNANKMLELHPGDKLWLITSGKNVSGEAIHAGFLVGIWQVREVVENPGDDPAYPKNEYKYRISAEPSASVMFDEPVIVDHIVRPVDSDKAVSIGRFLQGPRKLKEEMLRLLKSTAGPKMALSYLNGR